ncbi:hypothetical protein M9H77_13601 [Catharanthus roseus]|uniref:Uncharacterized protein n=1 Tax=Catharanthus roseus TaxID=4058 RepID=A0ACC0BKL8_CATRO|nr:hypothetical protein M9H77_13601 [Catharanthus roseus]
MITHIGGRIMLAMWSSGISGGSILGMALYCKLRIYQISMMQEVDDMVIGVIQGPPSSPTQIASFAKKVTTIIRRCMPSRRCPREPVPDRGAREVKRGAHRLPSGGARGGRAFVPPHPRGR